MKEEEKENIELVVQNLCFGNETNATFILSLKEKNGSRILNISIGNYDAQIIAMELENIKYPRPLTHDLIANIFSEFRIIPECVRIVSEENGVFFSLLKFFDGTKIDIRPSDAILIALKTKIPIFISDKLFSNLSVPVSYLQNERDIIIEKEPIEDIEATLSKITDDVVPDKEVNETNFSIEMLKNMLQESIKNEEYEMAATIRDKLKKIEDDRNNTNFPKI